MRDVQQAVNVHTFGAPAIGMNHALCDYSVLKAMMDDLMKNLHIPLE